MTSSAELTKSTCAILLAVYNGMQYMEEQISSILTQVGVDVTIFVSVDQSFDGSEQWLNELAARESRLILLPQGMKFGSAGKNFFRLIKDADFSSFDYVAFADQDDLWHPDKLLTAINTLKETSFDAYSSNVTAFWPDGRKILINKVGSQKRWDFLFEAAGPGCTYVMTQKLMNAIKNRLLGAWDAHQRVALHDWYCYAYARANGFNWIIAPEPFILYRQHGNNVIGVNKGLKAAFARVKKIRNGWWLSQAALIAHLVGLDEHKFIKSWDKLGSLSLLRLAGHAFQCRRKLHEQLFFLFVCLTLSITGMQDN